MSARAERARAPAFTALSLPTRRLAGQPDQAMEAGHSGKAMDMISHCAEKALGSEVAGRAALLQLLDWQACPSAAVGSKALWSLVESGDMRPQDMWQWVLDNNPAFKELATAATMLLDIVPTSASVERTFSAFGNVCTPDRARLTCERVRMLTYIYVNSKAVLRDGAAMSADDVRGLYEWLRALEDDDSGGDDDGDIVEVQ